MEKGINLQIEEFKMALRDVINKANMPISIVDMVLQELNMESSLLKQQQLTKEQNEYEAVSTKGTDG